MPWSWEGGLGGVRWEEGGGVIRIGKGLQIGGNVGEDDGFMIREGRPRAKRTAIMEGVNRRRWGRVGNGSTGANRLVEVMAVETAVMTL